MFSVLYQTYTVIIGPDLMIRSMKNIFIFLSFLILSLFHNISHSRISHIYIDVHIYIYLNFININMNIENTKIT